MKLTSLNLRNFRVYKDQTFFFGPGINQILGPNALGKTSILEAIYLLMTARSFRTNSLSDLIRKGSDFFHVELFFEKHGIRQSLKIGYREKEKHIYYNQTLLQSVSPLIGVIPGVVITPDDDALIKSGPSVRRRFLDLHISQSDPLYVHHLTRYSRALKQRNRLLKARSQASIETWETEMAVSGEYIIRQRKGSLQEIEALSSFNYKEISDSDLTFSINYKSSKTPLLDLFVKNRQRELQMGMTIEGPSREDFQISLQKMPARTFASEGQKMCMVASLRLAEWQRLEKHTDTKPIMLIDDVGISLDLKRRTHLKNSLQGLGQVFLTATSDLEIPHSTHVL